jgi:hypothetical protein
MAAPTPSQIAEQMSRLIDRWDLYTAQLKEWLAGVPDGGPYGDGRYPLTNSLGETFHVPCPAAEAARVDGVVNSAAFFSTLADAAKIAAGAAKVDAESARNIALSYRDAAANSKDLAKTYMDTAGTHAANAIAARDAAEAAAASVTVDAEALAEAVAFADADRIAAEAARAAAEIAAAAAATFDPSNFYTKIAADARFRLTTQQVPFADIGSPPTTLAGYGITDAFSKTGGDISGTTRITNGILRLRGYSGGAESGVVYFGDADRYIYKAQGNDSFHFKFGPGDAATINASGTIWTSGNFNPATKLDARSELSTAAHIISDWNAAVTNGWFMAAGAANAPAAVGGNWLMGVVTRHNASWIQQEVWQFTGAAPTTRFRRHCNNGTWGGWTVDQYFGTRIYLGNWPANNDYQGLMNASGHYLAMTGGDGTSYFGATGDVVLRAGNNNGSWQATLRNGDGAFIVQQTCYANAFAPHNSNGAHLSGNGGGVQANGQFYTTNGLQQLSANGAVWVRQPRIFVGGSDPGPWASDGDIWIP